MRTLQEKYNAVEEGNFSKAQFVRDANMQFPNLVSRVNSFEDAANILKNRGMIAEVKKMQEPKYSTAKPEDAIAPDVLDTGIKFELDKKFGTLDVSEEDYKKAKEAAIKNLAKDVLHYVKQDSIQLEAPKEKMEKVTLKEEISKDDAWKEYQEKRHVTDKTIDAAKKDFDKGWEEGKFRDGKYTTNEAIQNIENDEQTKRRIAKLTNQLLQDADPRDETVKAYAISVKNDLESGDASRMSQYKEILSLDDLKDDMEHYLTHDVDQLEEKDGPVYPEDKHTLTPDELGYDVDEGATLELSDEEMEKLHKDGKVTLANGSVLHYVGKVAEYEAPKYSEEELAQMAKDQQEHDEETLRRERGLEEQQLKELFKKIITKVITE